MGNNKVHLLIQRKSKQMGLNIQNVYCPSSLMHLSLFPLGGGVTFPLPGLALCPAVNTAEPHTARSTPSLQPVAWAVRSPGFCWEEGHVEALEWREVTWGGPRTQTHEKGVLAFSSPAHCQVKAAAWETGWRPAELPKQTGKAWEITPRIVLRC